MVGYQVRFVVPDPTSNWTFANFILKFMSQYNMTWWCLGKLSTCLSLTFAHSHPHLSLSLSKSVCVSLSLYISLSLAGDKTTFDKRNLSVYLTGVSARSYRLERQVPSTGEHEVKCSPPHPLSLSPSSLNPVRPSDCEFSYSRTPIQWTETACLDCS